MGRAIFISYRRDDTEGEAGRLFDDLTRSFGENSVFMDVSGINPGVDFRKAIDDNVSSCGVLLAVIGPSWTSIAGPSGGRRLDDSNDFVRLEIASALARDVAVIPVLVHDAKMPHPDQLPDNLKDLAFRNSVELTHARWNSDVELLTKALARYVNASASSDTSPVHATVSVQLPPPAASVRKPVDERSPSSLPLVLGIVAAAVVALGFVAYFIFRPTPVPTPSPEHDHAAVFTPAPVPSSPTDVPANSADFVGTWNNPTPVANNGLVRLEIFVEGNHLSVHAWGRCGPGQCEWGTAAGTMHGSDLVVGYALRQSAADPAPDRTATVTITPASGNLTVSIANVFANKSLNKREFTFVRAQ